MAADSEPLMGKTVLVTGAAKRLGRAIAFALARQGVHVVLHYRSSSSEVEETAAEIRRLGVKAWLAAGDFAVPAEADAFFGRAADAAGPIDFLVNSASVFPAGRLAEFSPDDLYTNINVNALAPLLIARRFAAQGRWQKIECLKGFL